VLFHAVVGGADDDVVEEFDVGVVECGGDFLGCLDVLLGGFGVAAGMVVDQDDGRGVDGDGSEFVFYPCTTLLM